MIQRIATPSQTKAILEKHDLYAKKNYGQNFLVECGIVEKIARHAVISDHCAVIEIGPVHLPSFYVNTLKRSLPLKSIHDWSLF